MYEFIEELTKEDHDLIEKVYMAVSLKPSLFVNLMYACYRAFNKRVESADGAKGYVTDFTNLYAVIGYEGMCDKSKEVIR